MGGCKVDTTEHGRYSLSCLQKTVSSAGSVWYVGSFKTVCCEILLLLNMADMDCLMWKDVE